jgi:predicted  nucleic acid-binding Zn-ribbon protein
MNENLLALDALQEVDSALMLATRQYQALDPGRAEQAAAETARTLHDRLLKALHETEGNLKDSELEQLAVERKKKDFESKLYSGKVQNPKELSSMQEEIEALGRQRGKLDERILTLMEELESRRAEEAAAKTHREQSEAALTAKQAGYKSTAKVLAKRIRELTAERPDKAAGIPAPLLKRYDAFRAAKQGVGIARIDSEQRCGACHTSLPSNLIRRVEDTESLELCENCGRLLCIVR